MHTVVNLQLSFWEISLICPNRECVKSEYVVFLAAIACRWNNPNQNMPWSPDSRWNSEERISCCGLSAFLVFHQINPLFRLQIFFRIFFHPQTIENDFWAPQTHFCHNHLWIWCSSFSENDICVILKFDKNVCFDVWVNLILESRKVRILIQGNWNFVYICSICLDLSFCKTFIIKRLCWPAFCCSCWSVRIKELVFPNRVSVAFCVFQEPQ